MYLKEGISKDAEWIILAQVKDQWRALVNKVIQLRAQCNSENFLASLATIQLLGNDSHPWIQPFSPYLNNYTFQRFLSYLLTNELCTAVTQHFRLEIFT